MKTPRYEVIQLENGKFGVVDTRHQITIIPVSGNEYKEPYAVAMGMAQEKAAEWAATLNECRPPESVDQKKAKAKAAAHLVAAGPELLEAAKLARDIMYSSFENEDKWLAVRISLERAIAKAEGRENE